jgi:raffinose/stachyose/melibiose transport system substrate-binding protein
MASSTTRKSSDKLGLKEPKTEEEFLAVLEGHQDGQQLRAAGHRHQRPVEAATMGFRTSAPITGRAKKAAKLIAGEAKLTDPEYVNTFAALAKWAPYLGDGTGPDLSRQPNLFRPRQGAIYAAGSWDISTFRGQDVPMGAFKAPPPAGASDCYISDHTDIGIGLNAKSPNAADAKVFLDWVGSEEFANIFANSLPGFFPLSSAKVTLSDDVAQTFVAGAAVQIDHPQFLPDPFARNAES